MPNEPSFMQKARLRYPKGSRFDAFMLAAFSVKVVWWEFTGHPLVHLSLAQIQGVSDLTLASLFAHRLWHHRHGGCNRPFLSSGENDA